ncbi:MAG: hypothetical protein KKH98_07230 [Spirochaetes bacterium]|nr:hypothetical protein [Spirochaetota bacterium]
MSIYTKIRFWLADFIYNFKSTVRSKFAHMALNIKYSPFRTKLFTKINNKTIFILIMTYIAFIIIQLTLFSILWRPEDLDEPKTKGYLSRFMFNYKKLGFNVENKLKKYTIDLENFAKDISVPFYLNWIVDLQKKMKLEIKNRDDIRTMFIFNHHGRLLNFAPNIEKLRNTNYQFTPYLRQAFQFFTKNRSSYVYFYTDSTIILNKYRLQKGTYIEKSKDYICEPFYPKDKLARSDQEANAITLDAASLFQKQSYRDDALPYLMIFTPIYNQLEKLIGIAGFNIDIDVVFKDLLLKEAEVFYTIVVNEKGMIVYALNKQLIGRYILYEQDIKKLIETDDDVIMERKGAFLKYKISISDKNWYMIAKIDPERLSAAMKHVPVHNPILYIFLIFEAVLFIALFLLFNKNITKPISNFSSSLKNLSKGRQMYKLELNHNDEFKLIEHRFNRLTDKVKGYLVFGKTISRELVDEYLEKYPDAQLETREKTGTILFLKIKNIDQVKTGMSKADFDTVMNKFLNDMEIFVSQSKGFIDSFSSDSFVAIFGVPVNNYNHAQNGYECSKKIFNNMQLFNRINKINLQISISINTGDIFYSQMESNYGKLLVSLGNTIRKAYYFESITNPNALSISEKTMNILSPKPKMQKAVYLKMKGIEEPGKVYLTSIYH